MYALSSCKFQFFIASEANNTIPRMWNVMLGKAWAASTLTEKEFTLHMLFVYGTILFVSWLFSKLVVCPYLSPLRKIPGRPRCNLFLGNIPEITGMESMDSYIKWVREMKTGIIRFNFVMGSHRVLVADADAMKHIFVTNAKNYPRPTFLYRFFARIVGDSSLLTLDGQKHYAQRRLCNSAFKVPVLQSILPTFQKCTERLCLKWEKDIKAKIEKQESAIYDIKESVTHMTFDIITEAAFGYECNSVDNPDENVSRAFNSLLCGDSNMVLTLILGKWYNMIPTKYNRKLEKNLNLLHTLIHSIISKKWKFLDNRPTAESSEFWDLLEKLLLAQDTETSAKLTASQLHDHVMSFLVAGHETTATCLSWALLCLAQHPEIQSKARQEVTSFLPPYGQPITYQHLEQLSYLHCIIKETLRLYPPIPEVWRQAMEDDVLCGYTIPKGTILIVSLGALHRNPKYWQNPDDFIPERFQEGSSIPLYTFQPFISGPHMCIGYKFALLELKMTLAVLLRQFEFSLFPDVTYRKKLFICLRPDPSLKLYVRSVN